MLASVATGLRSQQPPDASNETGFIICILFFLLLIPISRCVVTGHLLQSFVYLLAY